jgi:hypothetical protein
VIIRTWGLLDSRNALCLSEGAIVQEVKARSELRVEHVETFPLLLIM